MFMIFATVAALGNSLNTNTLNRILLPSDQTTVDVNRFLH
jgi:hypothetical protein